MPLSDQINGKPENPRKSDPASKIKAAPPNFGRPLVPHTATFIGLVSSIAKAYRPSDEALKHSLENARFMRNDCSIMECLEARQRGTALLNWHLEPEDPQSQSQKDLCDALTKIIIMTPRFTEMRRWLLEAIWFGRCATSNVFSWDIRKGKRNLYVSDWTPIHGDKLVFRYDDGSGKHDPKQIGIKFTPQVGTKDGLGGHRTLEPTDYGMAYFLQPWERSLVTLHRHMIEDGPFEDPQSGGRIHGVGVRDRIYWTWYQKQEALAMMVEAIERTGMGFDIWYYPAGNPDAKTRTEESAKNRHGQNSVLIPRTPGDPAMDGYGYDRIEPTGSGIQTLKEIVHEFFGHQIKRYILGQTLSTEADATGLGSGVADLHLESFLQIIRYDATNLEETLTTDFVDHLKRYNFPAAADIPIRFKIDTESSDVKSRLEAVYQAWSMGAAIKTSDVFDIIGLSMPTDQDEVLENPQLAEQAQLARIHHANAMGEMGGVDSNGNPVEEPTKHGESPQQALLEVMTPVFPGVQPKRQQQIGDWNVTHYRRRRFGGHPLFHSASKHRMQK